MTRQEVIKELNDIRSAIEVDGNLVAEGSLDILADKLANEGSDDISAEELDAINEMIYGSFVDPETICVELANMLMSNSITTEDIDPFTDDYWDDFDDKIAQEGCEGKELTEEKNLSIDSIEGRIKAYQDEIKAISDMTKDGVEDDLISVVTEIYEDGNTSLDHRDEKEVLSWIKKNSKLSAEEFFKKLVDQMNDLINRLQKSTTEDLEEGCEGKECKEELIQTTPTIDICSKEEAMKIINMDKDLLAKYEELLPYYEDGKLDYGFKYGNFFNLIEDESQIVIQWLRPDDSSAQLIVDSLEAAVVAVQDIETLGGDAIGSELYRDLNEKVDLEEAHYGKDSIIDGDIPGKENGFYQLITMRFQNMGFDEVTHGLQYGRKKDLWNPFGDDSLVMYGPNPEFFQPIVDYIESEVDREDSAWWNRDYEVCEVEGEMSTPDKYLPGVGGPWALCIEARDYDRAVEANLIPADIRAEYARRRKLRRASKKELIPV